MKRKLLKKLCLCLILACWPLGLAKMRDIILPSHGKKEYQVQVLMDGNLLKLEAKIQVEFTKVRFEDH